MSMRRVGLGVTGAVALLALTAGCSGAPHRGATSYPATVSRAVPPASSVSSAPSVSSVKRAPTGSAAPTRSAAPVASWSPCTTNPAAKSVYVSIAKQHLWMCAGHAIAYNTGITSGMVGEYTNTPTGRFTIEGKVRDTTLNVSHDGTYTAYPVKYWIAFQSPLFGFHDASWQKFAYGSQLYRTDGSHGCVHMPLAAIAYLYSWAPIGTPVTITS